MTEESPPLFTQNGSFNAQMMRQMLGYIAGVGSAGDIVWPSSMQGHPGIVLRPTHLRVTAPNPATMQVSIDGGAGAVLYTPEANTGVYVAVNNGPTTLNLSAKPGGSDKRIDAILAEIADKQRNGAYGDTFTITKVDGTADPSPTAPDLSGIASTISYMVLAYVTSDSTGIISISDMRLVRQLDGPLIGSVHDWAGPSVPAGYLLCDGSSVAISDYPDLYAVIGATYGQVDGNHFTVPDAQGRVTVGVDGTGQADRLAGSGALAGSGGAEKVSLTANNLPVHVHPIDHNHAAVTTSGATWTNGSDMIDNAVGSSTERRATSGTGTQITGTALSTEAAHTHSVDLPNFTGNSGNNTTTHTDVDNMPPYLVLNKIIRAY